jgi:hypothetical protein
MVACYLGEEDGTGSRRRAEISPSKKRKREMGPENDAGVTVSDAGHVEIGSHGGEGQRRGASRTGGWWEWCIQGR